MFTRSGYFCTGHGGRRLASACRQFKRNRAQRGAVWWTLGVTEREDREVDFAAGAQSLSLNATRTAEKRLTLAGAGSTRNLSIMYRKVETEEEMLGSG